MPAYAFTGLLTNGKAVKGVESADNVAALKATLKRQGIFLTSVTEANATSRARSSTSGREVDLGAIFNRIRQKTIGQTTRLLATLLGAGVTLPESLKALTEQVENERLKRILSDISNKVNEGSSLADALSAYPNVFTDLYINMVRAGEASGSLETVLMRVSEFLEQQEQLRSKVSSAMVYPIAMAVIAGGIVTLLMVNVVPEITTMFTDMNAELPWNTKLLITVSDLITGYWWLLAMIFAGMVYLFRRWRGSKSGRQITDEAILKVPVIGDLARKVAIARFSRTMSTMLASGVSLLQALEIVSNLLGNVVLQKVVMEARDNIREGEGIAPALRRSQQFPPLVTHMIEVGERSGQLEQMLNDVAVSYEQEVSTAIGRMTSLLEPLMIVIMGGSVGFIVFSIMQPIMMLNQMAGE